MPNCTRSESVHASMRRSNLKRSISLIEACQIDQNYAPAYVLRGNIYAAAGRYQDALRTRQLMNERGIKKIPGVSTIEINGKPNSFIANDTSEQELALELLQ